MEPDEARYQQYYRQLLDSVPPQLRAVFEKVVQRGEPEYATVRSLVSWFGQKRRGRHVVNEIRSYLLQLDMKTEPDFELAWSRFDRRAFIEHLNAVREIRNDVMHFHPDPLEPEDVSILQKTARLLRAF